jgi:hypothetical protein
LARAVAAYPGLRPVRIRASRLAVAGIAALGGAGRGVHELCHDGAVLADALATQLGQDRLLWLMGVRPPSPWHKPTLQLFDDRGRPLAYAKVGANRFTDDLVRNETATLAVLDGGTEDLRVPRLLVGGHLGERALCVTEPLPGNARRPSERHLPAAGALAALARRDDRTGPWTDSPMAQRLGAVTPSGPGTRLLLEQATALGGTTVRTGWWHGDWVPWNLAVVGDATWAFDWEYAEPGAPIGLDLVHHAFQRSLIEHGRPLAAACEAARVVAAGLMRRPAEQQLLTVVHHLALAARCEQATANGLDPDPRLAGLVDGSMPEVAVVAR